MPNPLCRYPNQRTWIHLCSSNQAKEHTLSARFKQQQQLDIQHVHIYYEQCNLHENIAYEAKKKKNLSEWLS